ncbi:uncharacterized protein TNCV_3056091 [Trichonephila clavipes]|nr:uncharacterized protein TNCV_3056091 [Trichonephila clavipes]
MDSPLDVVTILVVYVFLVKFFGPILMRRTRPYALQNVAFVYNIVMTFLNAWILFENSKITWFRSDFNWRCQSIDWTENEESLNAAKIGWILLIIKLLELLDTVFLVLWKEDSEISLKHLYLQLHSPLLVWYGLKFAPDGDRFNSCQVIYSQFGLAIHQNNHQARRRFVEWAQNEIAVVPDFHKRILFSDEAHFWLNGYVNKQNCRIWSEANPQVYVETLLHPEKLTVWCALWAGGIIGPYFFKNDEGHNVTVNGDRYRALITNFFIPELNNHDVQELWSQQDSATCHTARATIDLLKDTFGDRLISRFGPVNWPPRSCDLTPLDYFLWGYVKSLVYADKPQTLDHLEDNIRRVTADIRPQMLEKVIENWTSRLDYIRASRGSPMPEIIFRISYVPQKSFLYLGGYNSVYNTLTSFVSIWNHIYFMSKVSRPSHMQDICLKKLVSISHLVAFITIFVYNAYLYIFPPRSCNVSFFVLRLNITACLFFFATYFKGSFAFKNRNKNINRRLDKENSKDV